MSSRSRAIRIASCSCSAPSSTSPVMARQKPSVLRAWPSCHRIPASIVASSALRAVSTPSLKRPSSMRPRASPASSRGRASPIGPSAASISSSARSSVAMLDFGRLRLRWARAISESSFAARCGSASGPSSSSAASESASWRPGWPMAPAASPARVSSVTRSMPERASGSGTRSHSSSARSSSACASP